MKAWVPDAPQRAGFERATQGHVEVHTVPSDSSDSRWLGEVEFLVPPYAERSWLLERLKDMPQLSAVQTLEAGVDWLGDAVPDGVTLCSAGPARARPVAEWVLAAILLRLKRIPESIEDQREQRWRRRVGDDLEGCAVLCVGYGHIGTALESLLVPLGARFAAVTRTPRGIARSLDDLPAMLLEADVVVLAVPLTEDTAGLVDGGFLARMRDGALVVNAARGPVVERGALLAELGSGRLHAVLDVTDPEPLPPGDELWSAPNMIVTPHFAGDTPRAIESAWRVSAEQALRASRGEPLLNVVQRAGPAKR